MIVLIFQNLNEFFFTFWEKNRGYQRKTLVVESPGKFLNVILKLVVKTNPKLQTPKLRIFQNYNFFSKKYKN